MIKAHKGWCTPMTKPTCTGKRRQFALNMKKHARQNKALGGSISELGYSRTSPYRSAPFLDIETPQGLIDMSQTDMDLLGVDNKGNRKLMKAGRKNPYKFEGDVVREIPVNNRNPYLQQGGMTSQQIYQFLFEGDEEEENIAPEPPSAAAEDEVDLEEVAQVEPVDNSYEQALEIAVEDVDDWKVTRRLYTEGLAESTPYLGSGNPYADASPSSSAGVFAGIFRNEGARTGQPTNLNSSAIGRGQMIEGTRKLMYKKLGISDIATAEKQFKTNPDFEMKVLNAYREDLDARIPKNITGKQREYMIAKGWYTGNPFFPDNVVPGKSAGNRLTAGEYARRAIK